MHKAFIDVAEGGVEAAAATGINAEATSAPADPLNIVFDKPFVFGIRDRVTGAWIFLGHVAKP